MKSTLNFCAAIFVTLLASRAYGQPIDVPNPRLSLAVDFRCSLTNLSKDGFSNLEAKPVICEMPSAGSIFQAEVSSFSADQIPEIDLLSEILAMGTSGSQAFRIVRLRIGILSDKAKSTQSELCSRAENGFFAQRESGQTQNTGLRSSPYSTVLTRDLPLEKKAQVRIPLPRTEKFDAPMLLCTFE